MTGPKPTPQGKQHKKRAKQINGKNPTPAVSMTKKQNINTD
jgi:hypothetical protein